ncbi:hypothetical protein LIA77_03716 [Sarocladium implicatum]|nr:hypothetical protein LIA77_03716 [Sarocladium implicatum]
MRPGGGRSIPHGMRIGAHLDFAMEIYGQQRPVRCRGGQCLSSPDRMKLSPADDVLRRLLICPSYGEPGDHVLLRPRCGEPLRICRGVRSFPSPRTDASYPYTSLNITGQEYPIQSQLRTMK